MFCAAAAKWASKSISMPMSFWSVQPPACLPDCTVPMTSRICAFRNVSRADLDLMLRYVETLTPEVLEDSVFPFLQDNGLLTICKADMSCRCFCKLDGQTRTLTLMYNHSYAETDMALPNPCLLETQQDVRLWGEYLAEMEEAGIISPVSPTANCFAF